MAYHVQRSVASKDNPSFRLEDPPDVFSSRRHPFDIGEPVQLEHRSFRAVEQTKFKRYSDFLTVHGCWAVSAAFKEIVESLEPNVHQFFPITLVRGLKGICDEVYYLFNICQKIDSVVIDLSNVRWQVIAEGTIRIPHLILQNAKIVVDRSKIDGAHIWRGDTRFRDDIFFSDATYQAIAKGKLTKLRVIHAEERR